MSTADGAPPSRLDEFYGPNAGYVAELLERYRDDPEALDPTLRASLDGVEAAAPDGAAPIEPPSPVPIPAALMSIPEPASVKRGAIAPTIVTSSPSRIQTVPSPTMMRQWNVDHGRRSSRAGMFVRITW